MPKFRVDLYRNVCQVKRVEVEAGTKAEAEKMVQCEYWEDDKYDKYWVGGWEDDSIRESMIIYTGEIK